MSLVSIDRTDGIAVVTVDNPPVNALSQALRQGLWDAVEALDGDPSVRAVVLACAGRTFIAGADVTEFGKPQVPPILRDLVDRIEAAAKPWVAAIHGTALGGGFELAMGCRFRVALDSASVGLPEVALGIIPGASGTVRTPRLAGVAAAVEMVTTGRPVRAPRARELGLIDAVLTGELVAGAVAFARAALERPLPPPVSARTVTSPGADWWQAQRAAVAGRKPGEIAPLRALDCLRFAAEQGFAAALAQEREVFLELRGSDQAAALRHVFFAERSAPRPARLAEVRPPELRRVAVVGDGEIAVGLTAALRGAQLAIHAIAEGDTGTPDVGRAELSDADLVVLAPGKRKLLGWLDQVCRADAVLAVVGADGASWPVAGLGHAGRCIGLRPTGFAEAAALLEIADLGGSSPEALASGFALAKRLGLIPVLSGRGHFIGERLLRRLREAVAELVGEGEPAAGIDAALLAYGFRRGLSEGAPASEAAPAGPRIAERLVEAMAEEGRAMLAEGVAAKPQDIDLVAIHACGFPRWRGGPMFASGIA